MPRLAHCIYVSRARFPFDAFAFASLLQASRAKNQRLGLTGMLLYAEGTFFQVLEGPAEIVDALYDTIERDPRHDQVTRIIREPVARRSFSAWTMGFAQISRDDLAAIAGGNDFFGAGRSFAAIDAGRAKKLLAAFAQGRWRMKLSGLPQAAIS